MISTLSEVRALLQRLKSIRPPPHPPSPHPVPPPPSHSTPLALAHPTMFTCMRCGIVAGGGGGTPAARPHWRRRRPLILKVPGLWHRRLTAASEPATRALPHPPGTLNPALQPGQRGRFKGRTHHGTIVGASGGSFSSCESNTRHRTIGVSPYGILNVVCGTRR